jgi:hypothetical protein
LWAIPPTVVGVVAILIDPGGSVLLGAVAGGGDRPGLVVILTDPLGSVLHPLKALLDDPAGVAILTDPLGSVLVVSSSSKCSLVSVKCDPHRPEGRCCPSQLKILGEDLPVAILTDPERSVLAGVAAVGAADPVVAILTDPEGSVLPGGAGRR